MVLIRARAAGNMRRGGERTRAGLGGRANAQKRVERELETEIIDQTQDLAQPSRAGRPRDRDEGRTGGAHRSGKHVVEDGSMAESHGGILDPRVSGAIGGKRASAKRGSAGRASAKGAPAKPAPAKPPSRRR